MALSSSLSAWASILQRDKPFTLKQRIFRMVTASKGSRLVVMACVLLLTLGASQVTTISEASTTLMFATGFYTCTAAQACLARARRADTWLASQYVVMGSFLVLSISISVLATGKYYGCAWPKLPGAWGDWSLSLLQFASAMLGTTSYYVLCAIVGSLGIWVGGMYRALAVQFRKARSKEEVVNLIRHHQHLNQHSRGIEFFLADVLVHIFLACFTCPLSSTIDVLLGEINIVTFSSGPLLMSVFLPLSAISQELIDSSTSIGSAAYEAMFASDRRKPKLSCRGLGPLSLGAAGNAVRTWYSLVNMVVSSGRKTHAH